MKCGYNKTLRYYDASARFLNRYPTDTPRAPVAPACKARKVYILVDIQHYS